jgi:hypothetical protein
MNKNTKQEKNIVDAHKQALILSGQISDFQLKNLKTWPFLLFDDIDKIEIEYDFTKKQADDTNTNICAGEIIFNLIFKDSFKVKKDTKYIGLQNLRLWTKFLLWKDTKVIIKRNGKIWI